MLDGYPKDHTHTAASMADVMAKTFVLGLQCGTSELGRSVINSTASLTEGALGGCIDSNTSMPVKIGSLCSHCLNLNSDSVNTSRQLKTTCC